MTSTTSELTWIKQLLADLGIKKNQEPMKMYCDNEAACHIASNPVFHERTKYIEVDCHFIQKNQAKEIETPFIRSEDQLADVFTKELDPKSFQENKNKLGMINVFSPR
jgi:hypothetical protein